MPWAAGYDRASADVYLATCAADWEAGRSFQYAMRSATGATVGSCGLMTRRGAGILEIGYWVSADQTRRGVASAATAALTDAAFRLGGVWRVEIHHDEANTASGGVPRRLGFELTGRRGSEAVAPAETGVSLVWSRRRPARPDEPA